MSRIRTIKPELLDDDRAAELPHQAWRLMVSVFVLADDHGRIRASTRYLAANVFSGDRDGVEEARDRLCRDRFWIPYTVRGEEYALIRTFRLHQRIDNAGRPRLPGPEDADEEIDLSDVPTDEDIAAARVGSPAPPRKSAKSPAKRESAAVRRESPRNAALPPIIVPPTSDPERDLRAHDQTPEPLPVAPEPNPPEALQRSPEPSAPPSPRWEAADAPHGQPGASGAKPGEVSMLAPSADRPSRRALSDDSFGAEEAIALYNEHRPPGLPAHERDPHTHGQLVRDIVEVIRADRRVEREERAAGRDLERPGLNTAEGWIAFCERMRLAKPLADFTPQPTLGAWVGGASGARMRAKLWSKGYDEKRGAPVSAATEAADRTAAAARAMRERQSAPAPEKKCVPPPSREALGVMANRLRPRELDAGLTAKVSDDGSTNATA